MLLLFVIASPNIIFAVYFNISQLALSIGFPLYFPSMSIHALVILAIPPKVSNRMRGVINGIIHSTIGSNVISIYANTI